MKVQLWSYNYDPEPTGIAPVSTTLARGLAGLGHDVSVVAAHPHYPEPRWGRRRLPYRETREGVPVLRLPLWIGRQTANARMRQEASFMVSQTLALPGLGRPDAVISASPSFPALLPGIMQTRLRDVPWLVWLHDLLPDGAVTTGLVHEGFVLRSARWLERTAYDAATRVVVLSDAFRQNLLAKGVAPEKLDLIYDPATRTPRVTAPGPRNLDHPQLLLMGNIGYTQGMAPLVAAFEASGGASNGTTLRIVGDGMAAEDVRAEIVSDRVRMLGLVDDATLEHELKEATIGVVTQQFEGTEFNLPSKMMNYMVYGKPVLAAANPRSELARLIQEADAGWVVDSSRPQDFASLIARLAAQPEEISAKATNALRAASAHYSQEAFVASFDRSLRRAVNGSQGMTSAHLATPSMEAL